MSQVVGSVEDISKLYVSRCSLEEWVNHELFSELATGLFVRIRAWLNPLNPITSVYKIGEIVDIVESPKRYQLGKKWTNKCLQVRHGEQLKVCRIEFVSNSKFTQEDFELWTKICEEHHVQLPNISRIEEKLEHITHFSIGNEPISLPNSDSSIPNNPKKEEPDRDEGEEVEKEQEQGDSPSSTSTTDIIMLNNEVPPETLVFSINLLHSMILKNLSSTDWFETIRLVNSHWCSVATEFLQQIRFGSSIQFTFDIDSNCFLHQLTLSTGQMTEETLGTLTALINNSIEGIGFPCNDFRFSGGHLGEFQLQQFLDVHGSLIKKLTLNLSDDDEYDSDCDAFSTLATFTKLLTVQAPNLQYLGMDYFPRQWGKKLKAGGDGGILKLFPGSSNSNSNDDESKKPFYLPNLKTVDFEVAIPHEILLDLLRAAIKLEELFIPELNMPVVSYLMESNRLELLQKFFTFSCTPENLLAYEKFAEAKFKLMKIELDLSVFDFQRPFWPRIARCLSSILVSGSESLQRIFWCPVGHLPGLFIPTLTNVWTLSIQDTDSNPDGDDFANENDIHGVDGGNGQGQAPLNSTLFPGGISMKSIFPNLLAIDLVNRCSFNDHSIENFDPIPTVKKLSISQTNCFSTELIGKFAAMFPNVEEGAFKGIHNFPKVAKAIWKFSKLEELELGFSVGCNCKGNVYPALDVGLTGLTKGTCRMLLVMSEDEIGEKLDENLFRENASLLDLKVLESLSMEFVDDGDEMKDKDCTPLITELAGKYAFELLANLEINVKIVVEEFSNFSRIKKSLDQIRPYVSSGPW